MDIHNSIMDINNTIMDIHNSIIMEALKRPLGVCKIISIVSPN